MYFFIYIYANISSNIDKNIVHILHHNNIIKTHVYIEYQTSSHRSFFSGQTNTLPGGGRCSADKRGDEGSKDRGDPGNT